MKIKTNEICLYGMLGAILFALKFAMSSLPNIEPVSLLLISYTIVFGVRALYPLAIYVFLEITIYGFGFWSIAYCYIWLILVIVVLIILKNTNNCMPSLLWSSISGAFGLIFGALYMPLYIIYSGVSVAVLWWIKGIPYDLIHCIANFVLCMVLFKPVTKTLLWLKTTSNI